MTGPTHIAAWLIIGHLTWDYVTAVACSFFVDVDHLLPIVKKSILMKPKKIWKALLDPKGTIIDNQRNYFHSIFAFVFFSLLILIININIGIVFTIAYAMHLSFDMLDKSDFYPFYPSKKVNIKWFIDYCSKQEFVFAFFLLAIWILLIITNYNF